MSKVITPINPAPAGDTFQIWVDRTNEVIDAVSTVVVTANTHASGALTTGNGWVDGIFGGKVMVANTFRGGTITTSADLTISSNIVCTGHHLEFGDVTINAETVAIGGIPVGDAIITLDTSGATQQLVDSWDKFTYRGADYVFTIKDTSPAANSYQMSKVLVVHALNEAFLTEYAVVYSNNQLGEFQCTTDATTVRLFLTPTGTITTHVSGTRSLVEL